MARKPPKINELKKLISKSGGVCEFTDCSQKLVLDERFVGEIAHIRAAEPNGPRFDDTMDDDERALAGNLIVMCPTHHSLIDKKELANKYNTSVLQKMKTEHESSIKPTPDLVSDGLLDEALGNFLVSQTNFNFGSGSQFNSQFTVFSNHRDFENYKKMNLNNLNVLSTEIRRSLREDTFDFTKMQSNLDQIIDITLEAIQDNDQELLDSCLSQLMKIASWCFNEVGHPIIKNDKSTLVVLEMIAKAIWLFATYAVDIEDYKTLQKIAGLRIFVRYPEPIVEKTVELYSEIYRASTTDLPEEIKEYIKSFKDRFGWKDADIDKCVAASEYLVNLYNLNNEDRLVFPMHFAQFRQRLIYALLDRLLSDKSLFSLAFEGLNKKELALAIERLDRTYSTSSYRTWRHGFHYDGDLKRFMESNLEKQ